MTQDRRQLQQERTRLSWERTLLAFAVVGIAIVRGGREQGAPAAMVVAGLGVLLALWLALTTLRQGRSEASPWRMAGSLQVLRDGTLPLLVTAMVCVLCAAVVAVGAADLLG